MENITYLIVLDQIHRLLAELPEAIILSRVVNDFQSFSFKLEAEPDVLFLAARRQDHEARRDPGKRTRAKANKFRCFEGREVSDRDTTVHNAFELFIFRLVRREELQEIVRKDEVTKGMAGDIPQVPLRVWTP